MTKDITVIAHNIRSTHNIGSLFRTCEGLGVAKLYITGYSPYPSLDDDTRLPHISQKLETQINKTSLGAHEHVPWEHYEYVIELIDYLKKQHYCIVALEQAKDSTPLQKYTAEDKVALLLGEEVEGINSELLSKCNDIVEIPMFGKKESYNVSVAAAIALYHLRFYA